jgi:hypothetical protein
MTTVRRIYLYLATFIGMFLTVVGAILLLAQIVNNGLDAFKGFNVSVSSIAIALLVVGAIGWRFYWRAVQREANGSIDDRSAGSRKTYLFVTMAIGLWLALFLTQLLLGDFLVRLFGPGLNNYKPWTQLFSILILLIVWRWHDQVELNDRAANADGTRGPDLRRGYWYVLASFGVFGLIDNAATFLSGLFSHLGGRAPFPSSNPFLYLLGGGSLGFGQSSWIQTLLPPLANMLVAFVAVRFFWLSSQKAATAGDESERSSKLRSLLIHLVVLSIALGVLSSFVSLLSILLNRLLVFPSNDLIILSIGGPLGSIIVGGLAGWYFFKVVRPTLSSSRLSEYIIAGAADLIGLIALVGLIGVIINMVAGQSQRIESIIANILPGLLIGGGVWWWRWRLLQKEAALPENTEARSYLWRKVYQYVFQFIGLIMVLIGSVMILQQVLSQVMGPANSLFSFAPTNLLATLATPIALLIVGGGTLFYMLRTVSADARLSNMTIEEMMRHTLGDSLPTWAALLPLILLLLLVPIYLIVILALLGPAIGNIFSNISRNIP